MVEQVEEKAEAPSFLGMSDEEIMNSPIPTGTVENTAEDTQDSDTEDKETEDKEENTEAQDTDDEDSGTESEEEGGQAEEDNEESVEDTDTEDKKSSKKKVESEDKKETDSNVDYKSEYERLLAPFKANGRDIQVKSVDDAISLMQMGANYNKKMAALKPNLKLMKLLENHGLLNEDKLSYLIDLDKKNPEAINKLVKDSGLDPMDLNTEKASEYKQTTYTVDEREIDLDTVLDELQGTPTYNRTLDIVSNKWDGASKQVIAATPQILRVINDHMQNGIYDVIQKEIDSERMFGRLSGLSDIEAYRQIGDSLHAKGAFNQLIQGSSQNQGKSSSQQIVVPSKSRKIDEDKLKDKRRAASSTKPAAPTTTPKDFNPLALSDEEFSKLANKQYF